MTPMERQTNVFSVKIGGEAGFGIMSSGEIFSKTCVRAGLHAFDYSEYPSLIRGSHNTYQVMVADHPVTAWRSAVNILVALNQETVEKHIHEVTHGGAIIYDSHGYTFRDFDQHRFKRDDIVWFGVPLGDLAKQHGGQLFMRNTVALGAIFALLSVEVKVPLGVIRDVFGDKDASVVETNSALLEAGYASIPPAASRTFPWDLEPLAQPEQKIFVTGNEAIGLGAIQGGCKFYAAYPMTPSSTILGFLAKHGPEYGMLVRHAEDEIGVINETIGAAHAGVRAMCGTSGGGFALMTEAVGLAGMTEVGCVIVEAQRGGPSTGLPTWTEQGDLRQVLHASQGDFLKVVLAPGDVAECFSLTQRALNIAEEFQTPVIVLTDKYLAESRASAKPFAANLPIRRGKIMVAADLPADDSYRRYDPTPTDGVSPRSLPGTPHGLFLANSDEHTDYGFSAEDVDNRMAQVEKRARKAEAVLHALPEPELAGPADADLTVISWGSTKGVVQAAQKILRETTHQKVNHLHLWMLSPFPTEAVRRHLQAATRTVVVEGNQSGQLEGLLRQQTGHQVDHHLRQYDGRPFEPVALAKQFADLLS